MQPEQLRKLIGLNVKRLRERLGWSQADLASALDISQQRVSQIEHGIAAIPSDLLARLSLVLRVKPETLVMVHRENPKKVAEAVG